MVHSLELCSVMVRRCGIEQKDLKAGTGNWLDILHSQEVDEQEAGLDYKFSRSHPSDVLPVVKSHLLRVLKPSQAQQPAGDHRFKHVSL